MMFFWLLIASLLAPRKEFHQGVEYRIEARLDETTNVLTGRARMRYTNRSPDALDTIYFHLHLNAFRPNSAYSQRLLQFNDRRYQDIGPDDNAFDHISSIRVNGHAVKPFFPFAPDSTVMGVPLRARLRPNAMAVVDFDWQARLSTVPRRQGRKGRHYDWAHWYPRIAVYDTAGWETQVLLPQGEFYGEFASYDVTLDLADDQVVAATGVPVSGDPGWERANTGKDSPVNLQRTAYPLRPVLPLGLLTKLAAGRKRIRFRAEQVHHFAWSTDPAFIHEGGQLGDVALHAFYLPGDTLWAGKVIPELKNALQFYDSVMGPYVYPQLTAVHRVENGGTEFPMMQMDGANPPIVHEGGHEWAHAMLANNEWKEAWLDEGFTSFLGFMYAESHGQKPNYQRTVDYVAKLDASGQSQPMALPAAQFKDFNLYQIMAYTKPSVVIRMLRDYIGDDAFRKGMKIYYQKNKLTHVDENDFRSAFEQASGKDLKEFFRQWWHTTGTIDWGIDDVLVTQQSNGPYDTTVMLTRAGANYMPVTVQVNDQRVRVDSRDEHPVVVIHTMTKPTEVVLDPDYIVLDTDRSNNKKPIN